MKASTEKWLAEHAASHGGTLVDTDDGPLVKRACHRCGGTGHHSYCSMYGTTCFECGGGKWEWSDPDKWVASQKRADTRERNLRAKAEQDRLDRPYRIEQLDTREVRSLSLGYMWSLKRWREGRVYRHTKDLKHLGEPGERLELDVVVAFTKEIDGNYGLTSLHSFETPDGDLLTWWASGSADWLGRGDRVRIKATVKKHDWYKDRPQTVVNRVKVIN